MKNSFRLVCEELLKDCGSSIEVICFILSLVLYLFYVKFKKPIISLLKKMKLKELYTIFQELDKKRTKKKAQKKEQEEEKKDTK